MRRGEDEPARLDPDDLVDPLVLPARDEGVDHLAEELPRRRGPGVMSLKTIPFFGKSGTSRMRARTASMARNLPRAAERPGGRSPPARLGPPSEAETGRALDGATGGQEQSSGFRGPRPLPHLEVEVGAGGAAGLADPGDRPRPRRTRAPSRTSSLEAWA